MISVNAPAKINLFLHVTGRRADNYHYLDSLVAFTEYGDVIEVRPAEKNSLKIIGKYADSLMDAKPEDNLVYKAATILREYSQISTGAEIILTKNLPVASGIGGGSTDAAATISALRKLWKIEVPEEKLAQIAISLGGDVPVCLYKKTALMSGIGEKITPVRLASDFYIVLINPNIALSTAEIFCKFSSKKTYSKQFELSGNIVSLSQIQNAKNDLQDAAIGKLPIIGDIIEKIAATNDCLLARMSGSGATCFGLYTAQNEAEAAAAQLQNIFPEAWCVSSKIMYE